MDASVDGGTVNPEATEPLAVTTLHIRVATVMTVVCAHDLYFLNVER